MNLRDWTAFIRDGHGSTIQLAQLSDEMTERLGASSNIVHLHHDYVLKAVEKHRLLPEHFPMLDETLDRGAAISDRERSITFLRFDDYVFKRWFLVAVKRCNEARHLFVSTFHRTQIGQVQSLKRRYPVLREELE